MEKERTIDCYRTQIEKDFLQPLRLKRELLQQRRYTEKDLRPRVDGEFQRDYTRILYSSSFRRLQGKMQLFAVQSDQFIRNRLTHSLEVAQIARSIADNLGYDKSEQYVVEACALAHDMGNPGYGHAGERFLNEICREFGGFEGNAQTFRILTTVEQKRYEFQGLNLTYRTLLGVLKYYNRFENGNNKKFIYDEDYDFVNDIIQETGVNLRTLDVQIVDLADEIAYAAHDLEDGLRIGFLNVDEVLHDFCNITDNFKAQNKLKEIFESSRQKGGFGEKNVDSSEYTKLYRKEISSKIINTLISDIGIIELTPTQKKERGTEQEREIGFVTFGELASGLKSTIYNCVTHQNDVYAYETEGNYMMKTLFNFYVKEPSYLPPEYRAENIIKQYASRYEGVDCGILQKRLAVDYISGMMDEYVKSSYHKLEHVIDEKKELARQNEEGK